MVEIGAVVIGRNEGDRLVAALASIPKEIPVVYVDSGSSDSSVDNARRAGARVVALDLTSPFTAARARDAGYRALREAHPTLAYVQFIDGDCTLDRSWLPAACAALNERNQLGVVCGRRRERDPDASVYNALCDVEWNTPIGDAAACGGDAVFRCAAYDAAGGFDAALVAGEEPELCGRIRAKGWTVSRLDAPMTVHDAAILRFSQWWKRTVRCGFGYAQVWTATRSGPVALYGRSLMRAIMWALGFPAAIVVTAVLIPSALLVLPALYGAQIVRLARKSSLPRKLAWTDASLSVIGKFAETWGALKFARQALLGGSRAGIYYK